MAHLSKAPAARILVVEDDLVLAHVQQGLLKKLGYDPVGHATRGEEAIQMTGALRPDLVLMDIHLAGDMDGITAAEAIRTRFAVPVVFNTAFDADDTLARAMLTEPYGYILKPSSGREMRAVIEMALYKRRSDDRIRRGVDLLRASEQDLAITLQSIADAVIATDKSGLITRMNPIAERLTGWGFLDAFGRPLTDVFTFADAETRGPLVDPAPEVTDPADVVGPARDGVLLDKGGVAHRIAQSAAPIRTPEGEIVGMVLVFRDVSAHYRVEESLRRSNAELGVFREELGAQNQELRRAQVELAVSRARYFDLYDLAPVGYVTVSEAGLITEANLHAANLVGGARATLVRQPISRFIVREDQDIYYLLRRRILETGVPQKGELRIARLDGSPVAAHLTGSQGKDDGDGAGRTLRLVLVDISDRKHAEMALLEGQEMLRESALHSQTILDNMADGVLTLTKDGRVESFNKSATVIFGYEPEEVLGRPGRMLLGDSYPEASPFTGEVRRTAVDPFFHEVEEGVAELSWNGSPGDVGPGSLREVQGRRKDGSLFPLSLSVSKISRSGQVTRIGLVRDMSQLRKDEAEILRLGYYDSLTGLPNRRLIMDRVSQALLRSARDQHHSAVIFLDLDNFKDLNDSLGHSMGDHLLLQVATRLQSCARASDCVARLGGDEFLVLLEGLKDDATTAASRARTIAENILRRLREPYLLGSHTWVNTPSLGIVLFKDRSDDASAVLKEADIAMYGAKAAGRNTLRFFDPAMAAAISAHAELERDMRQGLVKGEFVLHYQIQVQADMKGETQTTGVEALVRWAHGTRGMMQPGDFVPLAEETGIILPLGQWVLETACAQLKSWSGSDQAAAWTMAVNVSASQFAQPDFVGGVERALKLSGADPAKLKLELTESMLVANIEEVIVRMDAVRALGVAFSLDDFGAGYSSLSYLKRLPLAGIKIDRSFVHDLETNPGDAVIVRTVVALGQGLGLDVVAEGVETAGQRALLESLGCTRFQGYHFGRPSPPSDLVEAHLLRAHL